MKIKINWSIEKVGKIIANFPVILTIVIYAIADEYVFRYRIQLKDDGSLINKNSIIKQAGDWCDKNNITHTFRIDDLYNFGFFWESDAVAFKIVWGEYIE